MISSLIIFNKEGDSKMRERMVDIFVATLMAALIQIQGLMVIDVGFGALAFGSVVVLTMFAAMAFDPRLIWDNMRNIHD